MPVHLREYIVQKPALDVLGAGSFGVVVKATRTSDGDPVALKIMACATFDGPYNSVVAARKEKGTLDAIGHHANITQLNGWDEIHPTDPEVELSGPLIQGIEAWMRSELAKDKNRPLPKGADSSKGLFPGAHKFCIAALKIAGEQEVYELLAELKKTEKPVSSELLRPVTMQLAAALKHVHSRGFGHFDVKLENIRITCPPGGDPEVTLVDFGLAVNLRNGDHPTQKGTEGIAAPEFFTSDREKKSYADVDKEKTGAADIFSLGVVLFTLAFFGCPPWAKATEDGLDEWQRGFEKYKNLSEPGRLLAYIQQTDIFKMQLSPAPPAPAPSAPPAPPAPRPMATGPTQPKEGEASQAPAAGAHVPPAVMAAPSDLRLIDLMSQMLQIDPALRPTAQEILEHDWITAPAAAVPAPASAAYRSLSDSAPPDTELVLPKLTRTHAIVKEGWTFAE